MFVRFNFDNRSNAFSINENYTSNVTEGKLKFNDYVFGLGYRIGKNKIKILVLFQAGATTYEFPTVTGSTNNFKIQDQQRTTGIVKTTVGLEFYVAKNAALTLETSYILHSKQSSFWNNRFSMIGISLGLTTTLF